jgi:hypothetical protein
VLLEVVVVEQLWLEAPTVMELELGSLGREGMALRMELVVLVVVEVGKISCDVQQLSVRRLMIVDSFYYIGYYGGGGGGSIYGVAYGGGGEYGIHGLLLTRSYVVLCSR